MLEFSSGLKQRVRETLSEFGFVGLPASRSAHGGRGIRLKSRAGKVQAAMQIPRSRAYVLQLWTVAFRKPGQHDCLVVTILNRMTIQKLE